MTNRLQNIIDWLQDQKKSELTQMVINSPDSDLSETGLAHKYAYELMDALMPNEKS
jgi:hypothetical protein